MKKIKDRRVLTDRRETTDKRSETYIKFFLPEEKEKRSGENRRKSIPDKP